MPKGCVALLGTGACARMNIDTHKHCKLAMNPAKGLVECCYATPQPMAQKANATISKNDGTKLRASWDGTVDDRMGEALARVQLEIDGTFTLVNFKRMHVDGQLETGRPICELKGCELPVEDGRCPKRGGPKGACCTKHHRQQKLFSQIGKPKAQTTAYMPPIGIAPAAFTAAPQSELRDEMILVWEALYKTKVGAEYVRKDSISVLTGKNLKYQNDNTKMTMHFRQFLTALQAL